MKAKHLVTLCLLAAFLAGFGLWGLLRTPGDVSQAERRPLAQWPELTVSGFLSGQYAGKLEHAAADQFPLREHSVPCAPWCPMTCWASGTWTGCISPGAMPPSWTSP